LQRLQRGLAAYAARRRGVEVPPQPVRIRLDAWAQVHADDVKRLRFPGSIDAIPDPVNLIGLAQEALAHQETSREFEVIARCAHCDGNAFLYTLAAALRHQADLQRLLHGDNIRDGPSD